MKRGLALAVAALLVFAQAAQAQAQTASGSLEGKGSEGAQDCKTHREPPLQVHRSWPDARQVRIHPLLSGAKLETWPYAP